MEIYKHIHDGKSVKTIVFVSTFDLQINDRPNVFCFVLFDTENEELVSVNFLIVTHCVCVCTIVIPRK